MKILLFGGTGMVGQGVLERCLADDDVHAVLAVGRGPIGRSHEKLTELVHPDLSDLGPVADRLTGYDACFFCLGVSSFRMSEADYRRITYDLTVSAAGTLAAANPGMTFVYVSGQGTDSSERGRTMWARVKGATENALFAMPLNAYAMRPGFIRPMPGVKSKTRLYAALYAVSGGLYPVLRRIAPSWATTSEHVGLAMLRVAKGAPQAPRVLENTDINALARRPQQS